MTNQSKKRKFLATSLTATMVAAAVAPVAGMAAEVAPFPDVPADHAYAGFITDLANAEIIKGMPNGNFDLGGTITRAQAAEMVAGLLDLSTGSEANSTGFTDVKGNVWYTGAINSLVAKGIVAGKTTSVFAPGDFITRGELAELLVKAYDLKDVNVADVKLPFTDVADDAWYAKPIKILYSEGLIDGQSATKFGPKVNMKRGDFAKLAATIDYKIGSKLPKPGAEADAVVESVKATNQTTLTVTGEGLNNLTAEDITVENNVASSIIASADGKTATITLQAALISEQATKVTVKENEGSTKEFTVTYEFAVTSVTIEDQLFDDDRASQKVKFKVNGVNADLDYLKLNGYDVTFVAKDSTGAASTALFATNPSSDGVIAKPAVKAEYTVEVQVTKSGEALVTDTAKVSVVNLDALTSAIESPVFYNHGEDKTDDSSAAYGAKGTTDDDLLGDDFVQNSTTFVAGEVFELLRLNGTVAGENELLPESAIDVTSSNDAVVSVGANNVLTAESAGTATVTFKVGQATKTVNVTVTNTKRVLTKVVADPASVKIVKGYNKSVTLKATDQYGDPVSVATADVTEDVPEDSLAAAIVSGTITDIQTDTPDSIGTMKAVVTGAQVGKGSIFYKNAVTGKVLGSILVDVSAVDNTGSLKLERIGGSSTDNTLELGVDPTITYELGRYNSQGVYVESASLEDMIIEVVDGTIATAQFVDSNQAVTATATTGTAKAEITGGSGDLGFVITATKAGKTDILIKDPASGKQEKLTITVAANPFKVTNVDFKSAPLVDYAGALVNYKNVLNVIESDKDDILTGVTLNKTTQHKVRISEVSGTEGVVYLDTDADGIYTSGDDIDLGFVEFSATSSSTFAPLSTPNVIAGHTTAAGDKGTLLFKFLTDASDATTAIKATSVQVDVK